MKRRPISIKACPAGRPKSETSGVVEGADIREACAGAHALDQAGTLDWGLDVEQRELLEFLAADLTGVDADPAFKERLRLELWWMILSGIEPGSVTSES